VRWRWSPACGSGGTRRLILPALTLAVWVTAAQTRLIRSFLREALAAPHLDALRLRGAAERRLRLFHVARPVLVALAPLLTLELVGLLEGAVVVERVLARPGVRLTFVEALRARDSPAILGFVAVAVVLYAGADALADALARRLDPRSRDAVHG
jgi:peptide/nickel transport system permease protein